MTLIQNVADTQRKPSVVHETHIPYNNMRYLSPAELSRMKTEKDAKTTHEIQLRKRQEEVTRAAQLQARLTPVSNLSYKIGYANILQVQHALQFQQLLQQQQSTQQAPQPQQPGTLSQTQAQTQPQQGSQQTSQSTQASTQVVPASSMTQQGLQVAQVTNIAQRSPNTLLTNQALGNFRGQVNISRINSPNVAPGAPRLTAQQILQLQQQVRPGSQPRQAGQIAGHQVGQQGQMLVPSLNGNSSGLNGTLTASFISRDSTSSPSANVTPPRKSATPTNVNSPRITVDQGQPGQNQMGVQVAGNVLARPTTNLNYYGAISGLTPEQLNVLRFMVNYLSHVSDFVLTFSNYSSNSNNNNNNNNNNRIHNRMVRASHELNY